MRALIVAFLFCCPLLGCASSPYTLDIKPDGSQFSITLAANPTTGFLWAVTKYDNNIFQLTQSRYLAPNTKLIGAGGKMMFTFVRRTGKLTPPSTTVLMIYARPWEKNKVTPTKILVNFRK